MRRRWNEWAKASSADATYEVSAAALRPTDRRASLPWPPRERARARGSVRVCPVQPTLSTGLCACVCARARAQDLVSSYAALCQANGAAAGAAADVDVRQLVADPAILQEAVDLARQNTIEWVEVQEKLIAKEPQFAFRVKEPASSA